MGSRPWSFGVTWRHRSRDRSTKLNRTAWFSADCTNRTSWQFTSSFQFGLFLHVLRLAAFTAEIRDFGTVGGCAGTVDVANRAEAIAHSTFLAVGKFNHVSGKFSGKIGISSTCNLCCWKFATVCRNSVGKLQLLHAPPAFSTQNASRQRVGAVRPVDHWRWRRRLSACVRARGAHFEHKFWQFWTQVL